MTDRPADQNLRCLACRAPMGTADTCPACGWSYATDPGPDPAPALIALAPAPAAKTETPRPAALREPAAAVPSQAGWGEVVAVLAVGVIPYCLLVVPGPVVAPAPYWADAAYLTIISACIGFVTLYLIGRSREPWERFGLDRPAGSDVLLGLGMLVVAELVWLLNLRLGVRSADGYLFPSPRGTVEYGMMVVKHAANAFAEELVTRAYLITRLEVLLRSRMWAIVLAAGAFASYHLYLGLSAPVGTFLFGLTYGLAYLAIRRVWPLVLGHALFNIHMELLYRPVG